MGLSVFKRTRYMKGFGLLFVLFVLWSSGTEIIQLTEMLFWVVLLLLVCLVIPQTRRFMARKLLKDKTGKNVLYLRPAYHTNNGKGYLAINDEQVLFTKRGKVFHFPIHGVTYMQWGNHGTGEYVTEEGALSNTVSTREKTLPIFSIEGEDFGHTWILRSSHDSIKFKKLMEKYGDFTSDLNRNML